MSFAKMPAGSTFHNQTLWGAIGWGYTSCFGAAAMAAPTQRVVLVTGEGSHQMTAQEVSQFHRYGLKPIIFVLNNSGYLIERLLCKDPDIYYNDLAQWNYSLLPQALGWRRLVQRTRYELRRTRYSLSDGANVRHRGVH